MKKIFYFMAILALLGACHEDKPSPYREAMENFAKANIPNPDSYEFEYEPFEKEYRYVSPLYEHRKYLHELAEQPGTDLDSIKEADNKLQEAFDKYRNDVACYEYSINFTYKGGENGDERINGVVVARYDSNMKLMYMTMRPDTVPANPALQILREEGWLP